MKWNESIADSGNRMRGGLCLQCETPLFSMAESRRHLTFIRVGALHDPDLVAPWAVISIDTAPVWARLDPNLPHYPAEISTLA